MHSQVTEAEKKQEDKLKIVEHEKTFLVVKENLRSFLSDNILLINLIQLAMLNGFFGGLTPIFALFIKSNNELVLLSNPVKISLLS